MEYDNKLFTVHGKCFKGKTFVAVHKTLYLLKNFCNASGKGHYVQVIHGGKTFVIGWKTAKTVKVFPLKHLPCTVGCKVGMHLLVNHVITNMIGLVTYAVTLLMHWLRSFIIIIDVVIITALLINLYNIMVWSHNIHAIYSKATYIP